MSELKHTPGPWVYRRQRYTKNTMGIESMAGITIAAEWIKPTRDEEQANLALILAAPELLEILIELLPLIKRWNTILPVEDEDIRNEKRVEAVIAKATQKIDAP